MKKPVPAALAATAGLLPTQKWTSKDGHWCRSQEPHDCAQCGGPFFPRLDGVKAGKGLYCSHRCAGTAQRVAEGVANTEKRLAETPRSIVAGKPVRLIPLKGNVVAIIDEADAKRVLAHKWHLTAQGYAAANTGPKATKKYWRLHRFILEAPEDRQVDHINGNRLDNRRRNLRLTTASQNQQNRHGPQSNSRTGVLGVSWRASSGRYEVTLGVNGKRRFIGSFDNLQAAADASREARRQLLTHFAESEPAT